MLNKLKKTLLATLIPTLLLIPHSASWADDISDSLPDIGTTAGATLSIKEEIQMGDYYVRKMRFSAPLIHDPLLVQYINSLGQRLVTHAYSVKTPFHFFLVMSDDLNAFTLFGGNVILHSSLFRFTDNESQLASVMAHEISHVTQRHLARAIEEQKHKAPLTWASTLGSILLAMANPQMGMAALTGALASTQQETLSFTQSNEKEADRIGIQVLQRAGFDPQAMPDFLQKLVDKSLFSSKPLEILLTHPLPDNRLADMRNRANQMRAVVVQSSQDYYMAKVRILIIAPNTNSHQLIEEVLEKYEHGNSREQQAAQYGRAIQLLQKNDFANAKKVIEPLLMKKPDSVWLLDSMTDIYLGLKQPEKAIKMIKDLGPSKNSPTLQLNLTRAYLAAKQPAKACRILNHYTWLYPNDLKGWDMLSQALGMEELNDEQLSAHAEILALKGNLEEAIALLSNASTMVNVDSLKQFRYDERIDQLRKMQKIFQKYNESISHLHLRKMLKNFQYY